MLHATNTQLGLLWHTLGLSPECRDSRTVYRNRFLAGPGHDDVPDLEALVTLGLMGKRKPPAFCDQSEVLYFATEAGEQFAIEQMPPAPPPPKRTRFDEYLDESECYDSFAHFLGINRPHRERRRHQGVLQYRMYRTENGFEWGWREVEGEWCATAPLAKASYKAALAARKQRNAA